MRIGRLVLGSLVMATAALPAHASSDIQWNGSNGIVLELPSNGTPSQTSAVRTQATSTATSTSSVSVTTHGGTTTTRIEVEANGQKKVLETQEEGTHSLSVTGDDASAEAVSETDISRLVTPDADEIEAEVVKTTNDKKSAITAFVENLFLRIRKLFQRE